MEIEAGYILYALLYLCPEIGVLCVGGYIEKERYRTMLYLARAEPHNIAVSK